MLADKGLSTVWLEEGRRDGDAVNRMDALSYHNADVGACVFGVCVRVCVHVCVPVCVCVRARAHARVPVDICVRGRLCVCCVTCANI